MTTTHAVVLKRDSGDLVLAPLCKTPTCAVAALSPFEGCQVVGTAAIAMEAEPITGMAFRLRESAAPLSTRVQARASVGVDGTHLRDLLDEVRSHYTRDDDLPDNLLPRIDAALDQQQGGVE